MATAEGGVGGKSITIAGAGGVSAGAGESGIPGSSGFGGVPVSGSGGMAVAGAGMAGGGGVGGASGSGGVAVPPCTPVALGDPLIDDFESGMVDSVSPGGIEHGWYQGRYEGEEQTFGIAKVDPPRPGSASQLAFATRGVGRYAMIGVSYVGCFAVPEARGIRFFVLLNVEGVKFEVRGDTGANFPVASGGRCEGCLSNWATAPLRTGWQEIEIPFERFVGGTHPYDPNDQLGFTFQWTITSPMRPSEPYEFMIDDLSYY